MTNSHQELEYTGNLQIFIKSKGAINIVLLSEISFIERLGRKTIIHLDNGGQISCNESLKSLYAALSNYGFFRPHQSFIKSFIIPFNQIERIEIDNDHREYLIKLRNIKSQILLSKHRYKELKDLLLDHSIVGYTVY